MLAGGARVNAVPLLIRQALRANSSREFHSTSYKQGIDRHKVKEIERGADAMVWCSDVRVGFKADRPRDRAFGGNIVKAFGAYGVDRMMAAIVRAWLDIRADKLNKGHKTIGSINSLLHCMKTGIYTLCLQATRTPASGIESAVLFCSNKNQEPDRVDFDSLRGRLQNSAQENRTRMWIDRLLRKLFAPIDQTVTTVGKAETPVVTLFY